MPANLTAKLNIILSAMILFLLMSCTKENFVEPPDPFEVQKLDPDPEELVLGTGSNAIVLKTNKSNIIRTDEGVRIKGSLFAENSKYGDIRITNGDFELIQNGGDNFYSDLNGFALTELPKEGFLGSLEILNMMGVSLGLKKGSEFDNDNFEWPVNDNRFYFYYENEQSLNVSITNSQLENIRKFAIDPLDPFVFMSCDFGGSKIGDLEGVGLGISTQGFIEFDPLVKVYKIPSFYGQLYLAGTIPLSKYPVAFSGEVVVAFNSGNSADIAKFFKGENSNFELGCNGEATVNNELLDWLNIEIVLGQASLYLGIEESGSTKLMFVGVRETPSITPSDFMYEVVGQDWDFLDYLVPYEQTETFYGTIGTEFSEWELGIKSESRLNILGNDIDMGSTRLEFNSEQMTFGGSVRIAGLSTVGVYGYANRNGNFKLTGYTKSGFHTGWHSLSLGYSMSMDVTIEHNSGTFTFRGRVKLSGEACVSIAGVDICADFSIKATVTVSSSGNFEVCFSIGIGRLGFDVCLDYDVNYTTAGQAYTPVMSYKEIPIEQVPIENRFPERKCN